jgi:hypothetical protein
VPVPTHHARRDPLNCKAINQDASRGQLERSDPIDVACTVEYRMR